MDNLQKEPGKGRKLKGVKVSSEQMKYKLYI